MQWWSAKLLRILNVHPRLEGRAPRARGAAAMIVANHISWVDVFLVSSVRPTRFIAKSEVRDWPGAGWIAERAGTIFIRRARRHDTARINQQVHEALEKGDCVGLFPEGATTEGDRLLKFHTSLFEPALVNGARIYPAAIRYEHPDGTPCRAMAYVGELSFMQSLGLIIRHHSVVARIAFAEAIEPAGVDRRAAARIARERVASLLGMDPQGTPPGTPHGHAGAPP